MTPPDTYEAAIEAQMAKGMSREAAAAMVDRMSPGLYLAPPPPHAQGFAPDFWSCCG